MPLRRALLVAAAAGLCACVAPTVRVSYPAAGDAAGQALARTVSQVYVLIAPSPDGGSLAAFARRLDKDLSRRGGSVLAYREAGADPDPFLDSLRPSSVLRVRLRPGRLAREDFEREVKKKGDDGVERVEKQPFTRVRGGLEMVASLAAPDGAQLMPERASQAESSREEAREAAKGLGDPGWRAELAPDLYDTEASQAAQELPAPVVIERERTLYVDDKDETSRQAGDKAQAGAWEEASALWAARLDGGRGGWKDYWDLALAAEVRRAFGEAERLYRRARESAPADPEAQKVAWEGVLGDVAAGARSGGRSEDAAAWFSRPTAVLPFSDETTSVEGPQNLRRMAAEALAKGGYNVLPLDDVDAALRRHGYSQGGQLRNVKPADLAAWTGAERVVFGHIAEFADVTLGFYGRRAVSGTMRVWDARRRADILSAERTVADQQVETNAKKAAGRLAGQLAVELLEEWAGRPLAPESAAWVERCVRGLPRRPARR